MNKAKLGLLWAAALIVLSPALASADYGKKAKSHAKKHHHHYPHKHKHQHQQQQKKRTFQASEMLALDTGAAAGATTLIRSRNQLSARVMVNVATAGDPYTVWWVVFNNSKACVTTPCATGANPLDDLLNPAVDVAVYSAGGAISAANGKPSDQTGAGVINLDVSTTAGRPPKGLFVLPWVDGTPFGDRLRRGNGFRAEVHLVVDRHPAFTTWAEELTTSNFGPNSNHRAAVFLPTR